MKHTLKWFNNRIGKRVYRNDNNCNHGDCQGCAEVVKNGLVIEDKDHAEYLYDVQCDMDIDYKDRP